MPSYQVDTQAVRIVAGFEGWRPSPYNDSDTPPNCTVCFGHELHAGPCQTHELEQTYTIEQGLELLHADMQAAAAAVNSSVRVRLGILPGRGQARFDALVSLAYNIGAGACATSSLVRAINQRGAPRDWHAVAPYWLEWDHDNGQVVPGLLARRQAELAVFVPGRYPKT